MILLAFAHARYWPYLVFGVMGLANVFDDAGVYSALQQVIPSRLTGRALGGAQGRAAAIYGTRLGSRAIAHPCLGSPWHAHSDRCAAPLSPHRWVIGASGPVSPPRPGRTPWQEA